MSTEKYVRYSRDVETLTEAWSFIMEHVDEYATPTIGIEAYVRYDYTLTAVVDPAPTTTGYTASIHGVVNA